MALACSVVEDGYQSRDFLPSLPPSTSRIAGALNAIRTMSEEVEGLLEDPFLEAELVSGDFRPSLRH